MLTGPDATPHRAAFRATHAARALATIVLVGMQPLLTQVPPLEPRSIIATLRPACARRTARNGPAWPPPMTIASYRSAITPAPKSLFQLLVHIFEFDLPLRRKRADVEQPDRDRRIVELLQ